MTQQTNKQVLILDGSHLAYRAYYKFGNLKTLKGLRTSIIYGMPFIIESLVRKHRPDEIILVHDGGRSEFRKNLLPTYKERKQKLGFDSENFYNQKDIATEILINLGVSVVKKKGFEADDLICMVARRYTGSGWLGDNTYKATIVSGDKDFNQLIDENTIVWNSSSGERYNTINLKYKTGYTPDQCVDYLCLLGDHSDNIPGYKGMGEKRTLEFLEKYTSISNFLKLKEKYKSIDNIALEEVYKRNRQLIDLKYFYRKFLYNQQIPWTAYRPTINTTVVRDIARKYEVGTFMKPEFLKTFTNGNL